MGLLDFLKKNKPATPALTKLNDRGPSKGSGEEGGAPAAAAPAAVVAGAVAIGAESAVPAPLPADPEQPTHPSASGGLPPAVQAYDEFGRAVQIPLESWRKLMLDNAAQAQDDPDKLYDIALHLLEFRLFADALPLAERLHAIDPDPERGTVMLGIARVSTGDAAGAARLYAGYVTAQQQRGEPASGVVLVNHAKALVAMGDVQAGEAMLWQGILADPNGENGLGWLGAMERERGGDAGFLASMQRVAALPGAWRPQLWLARAALQGGDLGGARALYREALARAGSPAPEVLLQSMSGDLGNAGHLDDLLALTRPAYVAVVHGLAVGNNLIKASLDTGRLADARMVVEELQRLGRPDWAQTLQFWETEVRQAELAGHPPLPQAPPEVTALGIDGPVWLPGDAPSRALFATASPRGPKVLFLAASVGYAEQPAALQGMLPDAPGRLSRALPLFLGESAFLHMGLETEAVLPWVKGHGFAVMGAEWADADAAAYARGAGAAAAVVLHIEQASGPGESATGEVRLRVVPAEPAGNGSAEPAAQGTAEPAATVSVPVDWANAGSAALLLWARLAHALLPFVRAEAEPVNPARYTIPAGPALGNYLLRLEQLLAVRCAGTDVAEGGFLSGEREIVRGQLDLALSLPQSLPLRLMLHETLLRLRSLRPEIVAEFGWPVELLQRRYPLADAQGNAILEQQLGKIFAAR